MNKFFGGAVAATLMAVSFAANALQIEATYDIYGPAFSDPGLEVDTHKVTSNVSLDLTGGPQTVSLFQIWTNESSLQGDDYNSQAIYVDFSFTSPELFIGTGDGSTTGSSGFLAFRQWGELTWNDPFYFSFGPNGDGLLKVELSDAIFNEGTFWGLNEGKKYGALVSATFSLEQAPSEVPEPGTIALLGLGLAGLGAARMRKAA